MTINVEKVQAYAVLNLSEQQIGFGKYVAYGVLSPHDDTSVGIEKFVTYAVMTPNNSIALIKEIGYAVLEPGGFDYEGQGGAFTDTTATVQARYTIASQGGVLANSPDETIYAEGGVEIGGEWLMGGTHNISGDGSVSLEGQADVVFINNNLSNLGLVAGGSGVTIYIQGGSVYNEASLGIIQFGGSATIELVINRANDPYRCAVGETNNTGMLCMRDGERVRITGVGIRQGYLPAVTVCYMGCRLKRTRQSITNRRIQ